MRTFATLGSALLVSLSTSSAGAAVVAYSATIGGAQEVPPIDTASKGTADLDYDDVARELRGTITLDLAPGTIVTNQHIHQAACGATGGIRKGLTAPGGNGVIAIDSLTPVKLSVDEAAALEAGNLYVNIHTAQHQGGEIRGQLFKAESGQTCGGATADGGVSTPSGNAEGAGAPPPEAADDGGGCSSSGSSGGSTFVLGLLGALSLALAGRRQRMPSRRA